MREKGRQTSVQCINEKDWQVNIQEKERQTDIQIRDRKAGRHIYVKRKNSRQTSIKRAKGRQTNILGKERQAETKWRIRKGCGR